MKILFSLTGIFLLTGCVVPDMDSSNYTVVPYVQTFQKVGHIGHTDREQRKIDLYTCGVDRGENLDNGSWYRNALMPGETSEELDKRVGKIEHCMERKGYQILGFDQCGPLKALTGLCN